MNIVIWNFQGALNPSFQSFLHSLVQTHHPAIMIITKTKTSGLKAKNITDRLQFDGAIHANNIGFTGGLWVLWDSTQVEVSELSSTEQEIHTMVRDISSNSSWLMSAIYASPRLKGFCSGRIFLRLPSFIIFPRLLQGTSMRCLLRRINLEVDWLVSLELSSFSSV